MVGAEASATASKMLPIIQESQPGDVSFMHPSAGNDLFHDEVDHHHIPVGETSHNHFRLSVLNNTRDFLLLHRRFFLQTEHPIKMRFVQFEFQALCETNFVETKILDEKSLPKTFRPER